MTISCGIVKEEEIPEVAQVPVQNELSLEEDMDSDGIVDALDNEPTIANYPKFKVSEIEKTIIELGFSIDDVTQEKLLEYSANTRGADTPKNSLLLGKLRSQQFQKITNTRSESVRIALSDFNNTELSKWTDSKFYPFENFLEKNKKFVKKDGGRFNSKFSFGINDIKNVKTIEDINVSIDFYDKEKKKINNLYSSKLIGSDFGNEYLEFSGSNYEEETDIYHLTQSYLDGPKLTKELLKRSNLLIKITNFIYTIQGRQIEFKRQMAKIKSNNAKVSILEDGKVETYYVSPGSKMIDFLKIKRKNIKLSPSKLILGIGDKETSLPINTDFRRLTPELLKKGAWSILGDGRNTESELKKGKDYFIVYSTAEELLNSQKVKKETKEVEYTTEDVTLKELKLGSEVILEITPTKEIPRVTGIHDVAFMADYLIQWCEDRPRDRHDNKNISDIDPFNKIPTFSTEYDGKILTNKNTITSDNLNSYSESYYENMKKEVVSHKDREVPPSADKRCSWIRVPQEFCVAKWVAKDSNLKVKYDLTSVTQNLKDDESSEDNPKEKYPFYFFAEGDSWELDEVLDKNKDFGVYNDGETMKFKFKITQALLNGSDKLVIRTRKDKSNKNLRMGYYGLSNCPAHVKDGFRPHFNTNVQYTDGTFKNYINIKITRNEL